jgi:hypothetical protein
MNVWRMKQIRRRTGAAHTRAPDVNFLTPLDQRTLPVARAGDWSGPWLWALDIESRVTSRDRRTRVPVGVCQPERP